MQSLYDYAMTLGVRVEFTDLTHLHRNGDYCHELRLIRIQTGMLPRKENHTLGHELGHAYYGHEPSMFPHIHQRQEAKADEFAAHLLISPEAFREAEERHSGRVDAMATDLYVLERTVLAYMRTLARIGDDVYVNPRMGIRQWFMKLEAV